MIINPRGAGGSGKTELIRRILALFGWRRELGLAVQPNVELIVRAGQGRPLGYRLPHPTGGRPLVVVGHYEVTSGGCDTIRKSDGGLGEIIRLADQQASAGDDVIIEGLSLSNEVERTAELAKQHRLQIIRLATPPEQCVRHLARRRRIGRQAHSSTLPRMRPVTTSGVTQGLPIHLY